MMRVPSMPCHVPLPWGWPDENEPSYSGREWGKAELSEGGDEISTVGPYFEVANCCKQEREEVINPKASMDIHTYVLLPYL